MVVKVFFSLLQDCENVDCSGGGSSSAHSKHAKWGVVVVDVPVAGCVLLLG